MTLIVNLFAGPGAGKSTTAAGLFHIFKASGRSCELVTEFAKQCTWEKRQHALQCQPYVFGKQLKNLTSVVGKVDIVITDSPILLSCVYSEGWPESFKHSVIDIFNRMNNLNYFLIRNKPYVVAGRNQTESEARTLDIEIRNMLDKYAVEYVPMLVDKNYETILKNMVDKIEATL